MSKAFANVVIRIHIMRPDAILISHYFGNSLIERRVLTDLDAAMKYAADTAKEYIQEFNKEHENDEQPSQE